jgi:citrate synthase
VTVTEIGVHKSHHDYRVLDLCRRHSFEEVAYLLWHGELPTREQISAQIREERVQRATASDIGAAIARQPFTNHPIDTLRITVSLLGAGDAANHDPAPATIRAQALRLFAVLPSVIAMDQRRRNGLGAVAPSGHLSYVANLLYMTFGKVPEPQIVAAFETSLILSTEDSVKAVPFAAVSDLYGAVAAALGTFKNTPDAEAGEAVMAMLNEIAIPDNAKPWLEETLADGRKIPGFGHLVRKPDSRVPAMRAALSMITAFRGGRELLEIYEALATAMYEATGLRPNLHYPASLAYHLIGFDAPTFAPIFIAACLPGWTAHITGHPQGQ